MRKKLSLLLVMALALAFVGLVAGNALAVHTECHDGADNDGDSLIDFPADPGCDSEDDFHEAGGDVVGVQPSCRASAVRVLNLLTAITLEPFVANDQGVPCVSEDASFLPPTTIGPVAAAVLTARTEALPTGAVAAASAANVGLSPPGIGATAALAFAVSDCSGPTPAFAGESIVVGLFGLGGPILIPPGHTDIPLGPLGTLHLNEEIVEPNRITVRAIWFESATPLVDEIVVAEAIADCELGTVPPTHTPTPTPTHTGPPPSPSPAPTQTSRD